MLSDAPKSSWHPALMPNSVADLRRISPNDTTPSPPQDEPVDDRVEPVAASAQTAGDYTGGASDAWLPDHDTRDSRTAEATDEPVANPESPTQPDSAEPTAHAPPAESSASKHLSTMSFTRTVPHEVNWTDDDDDAEWDLQQTGTTPDPSKFMSENTRTNSFPPAPSPHSEASHELAHPISFNQAEDMIREIEQEEIDEDGILPDAMSRTAPGGPDAQDVDHGHDSHHFASDAFNGAPDEALDARFEEGIPLVASAEEDDMVQAANDGGPDLFGEDAAGEEDDFFSNVRGDSASQQDDFRPPAMERKSTMDVLKSLDMGSSRPSFAPLQETVEESAREEEPAQEHEINELPTESSANPTGAPKAEDGQDLDAKWEAMFADEDDEDFLPDEEPGPEELDAAAFLGSDDEGLLDDAEIPLPASSSPIVAPGFQSVPAAPAVSSQYMPPSYTPATTTPDNPYLPAATTMLPTPASPYLPVGPALVPPSVATPFAVPSSAPAAPAPYGYGAPPPQEKIKAQSFVDKAKGGYTSPYDLPMDVVKPKRRASAQPLQRTTAPPQPLSAAMPPPPRSASSQSHSSPAGSAPVFGMGRPGSSHSAQGSPGAHKPHHESFFEELPITTKPRPTSRQSHRGLPSPAQPSPYGPPPQSAPPPVTAHPIHPPAPLVPSGPGAAIPNLVAPPRANPYASLGSAPALSPAVPAAASRYSPAPPGATYTLGAAPVPPGPRYSPAPPASRQPSGQYGVAPVPPGPPTLPHLPRTSSPLAHFEISHERSRAHVPINHAESSPAEKRNVSSVYEPRLQRVPSLPPTREVEEEETWGPVQTSPGRGLHPQPASPPQSRYAPPAQRSRATPPPPPVSGQTLLSPPKRAMPGHSPLAPPPDFAPPLRSQTQSPGALYGSRPVMPADPIPRPSSVHDVTSPRATSYSAAAIPPGPVPGAPSTTTSRPRGFSLNLNVIPPTDGRENDPLQRWRGAPLITWGVGGTLVTMFPKEVPRYGMNSSIPAVVRSPGEVKIQNAKDIIPFEERLAKFPGPLKGKSKKKETVAWLTTGIESLERGLPNNLRVQSHLSHEDKRAAERVLLWKILRLLVEHDGVLEGNPTVETAVREFLTPGLEASGSGPPYTDGAPAFGLNTSSTAGTQSDAVSSSTVEQMRHHLLRGDCEKAVWAAVDQRLWGHALLLSNALAPELYKKVSQEFVKKEVNLPGHESLAALYEVLAGNHEDSVDELVPVHARAGLQLMAKDMVSGPSKDAMEGLDKWRETLGLILSNRSTDDVRAINSLGVLLSGYGRAEAAHICFMFARSHTIFGGLDDPASHFVLVGSDHKKQAEQFAKEIEPLLLSEVYEYGQSLAGGSNVPVTIPHLAAYKLQHALALAEYGLRDKALQYCEAIATAITAQTKRSPYHHPILEHAVEDLMMRLRQAPKEESNSWIPKPSMNKVSDSVWNRFNKFVAGEDDNPGQASSGEGGEAGPFARVAGDTPTISRTSSVNNLETFGAVVPSYGAPPPLANGPATASAPPTRAASRYAPGQPAPSSRPSTSSYVPRSSMERTSSELNRGSFELPRRSLEMQAGRKGTYSPARSASPAAAYSPHGTELNSSQESPYGPASQTYQPQVSAQHQRSPLSNGTFPESVPQGPAADNQAAEASSHQPPSYGFEAPPFNPYAAPVEENKAVPEGASAGGAYEAPSYQPYAYEPPTFEAGPPPSNDDASSVEEPKPKPKKKGIMYDDEDDFPVPRPAEKSKEEKDRENAELFRKAAEEDAKHADAAKQTKKGWGFTSWFGGSKKEQPPQQQQEAGNPNKPIRAKLGEPNSFHYDPELKRWVNKNAGAAEDTAKKFTPPPPRGFRSTSSSPAPPSAAAPPPAGGGGGGGRGGRASAPPAGPPRAVSLGPSSSSTPPAPSAAAGRPNLVVPGGGAGTGRPVGMLRSVSNTSAPPTSRPALSSSNSIDDLIGAAGPRRPGAKKARKSARYVDVMMAK
ncbi:hypothetical protein BT67DRAFT_453207 [Trichocladium antarcticum]|uniref:Protein transport protein sec16 n=1 Tax=Trichocladium antarcticum TaxID=1450529 RepID=A0AAN6ZI06_9PEZI|nr:hypothetical protein BT67DRAFT_453207 [Trichocladium antarcticum]